MLSERFPVVADFDVAETTFGEGPLDVWGLLCYLVWFVCLSVLFFGCFLGFVKGFVVAFFCVLFVFFGGSLVL